MGQEMIKRFFSSLDEKEKKPIKPWIIWLIVGAILFLALGSVGDSGEKSTEQNQPLVKETDTKLYLESLEQRLKATLEKITGAGEVSVFLYLEDNGEQILAANRILKNEEEEGVSGTTDRAEEENDIVLWDKGGAEIPYPVKQRVPQPTGILVVAEGAGDDDVEQEIYEAVRAVFGLPAHRIKITN